MIKPAKAFMLLLITTLFVSCGAEPKRSRAKKIEENKWVNLPQTLDSLREERKVNPQFEVSIKTESPNVKTDEDLVLAITFKNNTNTTQMYLLTEDVGMGYWWLSARVINLRTKKSAVEYECKAILNSSLHSKLPQGKILEPGKSVTNKLLLGNIAKYYDFKPLGKGRYSVQVDYNNSLSNVVEFEVK